MGSRDQNLEIVALLVLTTVEITTKIANFTTMATKSNCLLSYFHARNWNLERNSPSNPFDCQKSLKIPYSNSGRMMSLSWFLDPCLWCIYQSLWEINFSSQ